MPTISIYVDEDQKSALQQMENQSEFSRRALDAALQNQSGAERRLNEIESDIDDIDAKIRSLKQERGELEREREELEGIVGAAQTVDENQNKRLNIVVEAVEEMMTRPADTQMRFLKLELNEGLATTIRNEVNLHTLENADTNAVSGEMVIDDLRDDGFDPDEAITGELKGTFSLTDEAFDHFKGLTPREVDEIEAILE